MNRKKFIQTLGVLGLTGATMKLHALDKFIANSANTEKMPVLLLVMEAL